MMIMIIIKDIYDDDHHQAMLLLSPVDGVDPFGLVPTFCITPPQPLHFRFSSLSLLFKPIFCNKPSSILRFGHLDFHFSNLS